MGEIYVDTLRIYKALRPDRNYFQQVGDEWLVRCPIPGHEDKNPSCRISGDGRWYCFRCNEGGHARRMVELVANLPKKEAWQRVLEIMGVSPSMPTTRRIILPPKPIELPPPNAIYGKRKELLDCVARQAEEYKPCLNIDNPYMRTLRMRLGADWKWAVQTFGIGISPASGCLCYGNRDVLLAARVARELSDGRLVDFMRGRIVFPIHSPQGHVLGFTGRSLEPKPKKNKYLNTPTSEIFYKGSCLYGFHLAYTHILKAGYAILVEGNLDCISLHAVGVRHVVASMGINLSKNQCLLLKSVCRIVIVNYDNDDAGRAGGAAAALELQRHGIRAALVVLQEAHDPDEFMRTHTREDYLGRIENKQITNWMFGG